MLADDSLNEFARIAVQGRARRVFVVSPWMSVPAVLPALAAITEYFAPAPARLTIITRAAGAALPQRAAVQDLVATGASVYGLPDLHAKMCYAELPGGRVAAVVGSANMTANSQLLREVGVLLMAKRRSRLGRELEDTVHVLKAAATRVTERDLVAQAFNVGVATDRCSSRRAS